MWSYKVINMDVRFLTPQEVAKFVDQITLRVRTDGAKKVPNIDLIRVRVFCRLL